MKFRTESQASDVSTASQVGDLVDGALRNRELFALENAADHSLSVAEYDRDGVVLSLHKGSESEGWISKRSVDDVGAIFREYCEEPLTAEGIEKRGEWLEVGTFPRVLVHALILIAVVVVVLIIVIRR
jgi:hypothetical protein